MIELKRSKLRQDLMIHFLSNKSKQFYLRQLERDTNHYVSNIRKELNSLKSKGLFTTSNESNRVYYKVNANYKYWDEIIRDVVLFASPDQILSSLNNLDEYFLEIYSKNAEKREIPPYDLFFVGETDRNIVEKYISELKNWTDTNWRYSLLAPNDDEYLMLKVDPNVSLVWSREK